MTTLRYAVHDIFPVLTRVLLQWSILAGCLPAGLYAEDLRWWPTQAAPRGWVSTTKLGTFPEPHLAYHALVESIAGLAAKAVNDGSGDELVWISNGNAALELWRSLRIKMSIGSSNQNCTSHS